MGKRMPETCSAVFKRQVINLREWCIWLVDIFVYTMMHGLTTPEFTFRHSTIRSTILLFDTCSIGAAVTDVPADEDFLWVKAAVFGAAILQLKSNTITGLDRPWGFQEVEAPRFQDNRHMKVVRLSALRIGRFYHPGNIPGTHFC